MKVPHVTTTRENDFFFSFHIFYKEMKNKNVLKMNDDRRSIETAHIRIHIIRIQNVETDYCALLP